MYQLSTELVIKVWLQKDPALRSSRSLEGGYQVPHSSSLFDHSEEYQYRTRYRSLNGAVIGCFCQPHRNKWSSACGSTDSTSCSEEEHGTQDTHSRDYWRLQQWVTQQSYIYHLACGLTITVFRGMTPLKSSIGGKQIAGKQFHKVVNL